MREFMSCDSPMNFRVQMEQDGIEWKQTRLSRLYSVASSCVTTCDIFGGDFGSPDQLAYRYYLADCLTMLLRESGIRT